MSEVRELGDDWDDWDDWHGWDGSRVRGRGSGVRVRRAKNRIKIQNSFSTGSSAGGCRPSNRSTARIRTARSRFRPNVSTVALPMGVRPFTVNLLLDQMK
jgi:hypothetical protein